MSGDSRFKIEVMAQESIARPIDSGSDDRADGSIVWQLNDLQQPEPFGIAWGYAVAGDRFFLANERTIRCFAPA